MPDNLNIFGIQYPGVKGFKLKDTNGNTQTYIKPEGTLNVTSNGTTDVTNYASVNVNLPSSVSLDTLNVSHNGTYTPETGHAYSPVNVNVLGGNIDEDADVVFMDYDGTILYTYTAAQFANLTALPPNPSHTGLTAQGWNWTLADAKTYVQTNGFIDIGQNYVTDDGATRIYVNIDSLDSHPDFSIQFYNSTGTTTVIDWGDDTTTSSTVTSLTTYTHNYSSAGLYTISLTSNNGGTIIFPNSGSTSIVVPTKAWQQQRVVKVEFGSNIKDIKQYNFYGFRKLETVSIPKISGLTFSNNCFEYCNSLKAVVFPPDCSNNIGNYAFRYDYDLIRVSFSLSQTGSLGNSTFTESTIKRASIPNNCTVTSTFYNCKNLKKTIFPTGQPSIGEFVRGCIVLNTLDISGVTTISANAFNNCQCLKSVTLNSEVTVINASVFQSCNALSKIIIPENVTTIKSSAFEGCQGLVKLTIPNKVTSIEANAFKNCNSILEYHFLGETPPTLANTNAFTGIVSNCIIYVPRTANPSSEEPTILEKYQTATNWSTYASYMQEEPES